MRQVNSTNYALASTNAEGVVELKNYSEGRWQAMIERATKEGQPAPTPDRVQTFVVYEAETPADFAELASDDVQVALFNRGASLKQLQEIRDLMESDDFTVTEGGYDLKDIVGRVTERRSASPESRVEKLLGQLDADALSRVLAKLQEQTGARV